MKGPTLTFTWLLLGGFGVTAWMVDLRGRAERIGEDRRQELLAAEAQVMELHGNLAIAAAKAAAVQGETEQRASSGPVSASSEQDTSDRATQAKEDLTMSQLVQRLHRDLYKPGGQLRMLARQRTELSGTFAPLYRKLQLTPDQIALFESNHMRREEAHSDLNAAAQAQGLALDDPAVVKLRGTLYAEHEKSQRELLGPAGFQAYRDFERTSSPRRIVRDLATAALLEGIPFTVQQSDRLVEILAHASPGFGAGGSAGSSDTDWEQVDAGLSSVLSEAQVAFVRTVDPGEGLFFARWNAALLKASALERSGKK